jgi:hypothetical protein
MYQSARRNIEQDLNLALDYCLMLGYRLLEQTTELATRVLEKYLVSSVGKVSYDVTRNARPLNWLNYESCVKKKIEIAACKHKDKSFYKYGIRACMRPDDGRLLRRKL